MTNENTEEKAFEDMTVEEMDAHLAKAESAEPVEESVVIEEEPLEPSEPTEPEAQNEVEEPVNEQADIEPDDDIPLQYRNKSEKDWYEMQKNANTKISQQNNELYHLRKLAEERQAQQSLQQQQAVTSNDDELLASYETDDISAIEKIVERKLRAEAEAREQRLNAERESSKQDNDYFWDALQEANPELHASIKEDVIQAMVKDPENTYYQKGWVRQYVAQHKQSASTDNSGTPSVDKSGIKRRAVTVGSGSRVKTQTKKSVSEMTSDEYAKHFNIPVG